MADFPPEVIACSARAAAPAAARRIIMLTDYSISKYSDGVPFKTCDARSKKQGGSVLQCLQGLGV
jgi:hypothetical protein